MYQLKISKGAKIIVNDSRHSGLSGTFEHGKEYPQEVLEQFYNAGFKFVTKSKPKKDAPDENIQNT